MHTGFQSLFLIITPPQGEVQGARRMLLFNCHVTRRRRSRLYQHAHRIVFQNINKSDRRLAQHHKNGRKLNFPTCYSYQTLIKMSLQYTSGCISQ